MCGIAGIFHYHSAQLVDFTELNKINDHLRLRGPDDAGVWVNEIGNLGLAHRRLSIIDLSQNAKQPMQLVGESLWITFNGEIYNYQTLRDELAKQGHCFETHSDTEVILKLYQLHGENMLNQLRGMFSFAIWDEKNKTLFCARDPFGIKPFYFSDNGKSFRFASQVKALLAGESTDINQTPNPAGHVGFFLLGSVPEPDTLYEGIQSLSAGSYLILRQQGKRIQKQYYDIRSTFIRAENHVLNQNQMSLTDSLYDTTRHHLVSDVEVGIFLSAGIDSSTLTNVASEIALRPLQTMTLGFKEYQNTEKDEVSLSKLTADTFDTHQHIFFISAQEAQDQYANILTSMDQPSIDGINTYFVSQISSKTGLKVALSGLGADEIFSGYPHFSRIPRLIQYAKYFSVIGKTFRQLTQKILSAKHASLFEYSADCANAYFLSRALFMPWELEDFMDRNFLETGLSQLNLLTRFRQDIEGIQSIRFQISALELQWYMRNQLLRDTDWAGMAHSLEIRVPFVDVQFFENSTYLSAQHNFMKPDLANASHRKLPQKILNKKKTGFNIPVSTWFSKSKDIKPLAKMIYQHFSRA